MNEILFHVEMVDILPAIPLADLDAVDLNREGVVRRDVERTFVDRLGHRPVDGEDPAEVARPYRRR